MKKIIIKICTKLLPTLVLIILALEPKSEAKNQYVTPLNMGMKVSVPWDIANLFNRYPIQGALAALLAIALAAILFFGVITSPFGYMFGVPSEKYVLGDLDAETLFPTGHNTQAVNHNTGMDINSRMDQFYPLEMPTKLFPAPRGFDNGENETGQEFSWRFFKKFFSEAFDYNILMDGDIDPEGLSSRAIKGLSDIIWNYINKLYNSEYTPNFLDSMFYFMPNSGNVVRSMGCDLLTVCYAHGALKRLPMGFLRIYQVFSRKMSEVPNDFKKAMLIGMEDEHKCSENYSEVCKENAFTITLKSYLNFLPIDALSKGMPKRKQAMYM